MNCSDIRNQISAHFDNELTAESQVIVEAHLEQCAPCKAEFDQFRQLSRLSADVEIPQTPSSVWLAIEKDLSSLQLDSTQLNGQTQREGEAPAEPVSPNTATPSRPPNGKTPGNRLHTPLRFAAALAATILFCVIGWTFWHGNHVHKEMVEAMEQVATEINSDEITTLLLSKFGGSTVTYQEAITQVGFRPVASEGLPAGYSVESIQVLDMPCCQCTQTACQRPDKTRFFIFEHEDEETGWFEHRNQRQSECCGKTCKIVELEDQLAVTWQKDNRHITLLGVRDEKEMELLVSQFDKNS